MGDQAHLGLTAFLQSLESKLAGSEAVIIFTAHWESDVVTVSGASQPQLLFDYYGFPEETYTYAYPVSGAPGLAIDVMKALDVAGIRCRMDGQRGLDHGTFIPMMLMRPKADIPVLQVSLLTSLNPESHLEIGRALAPLLDRNVTFVGSGLSFHNVAAMFKRNRAHADDATAFDDWLNETLLDQGLSSLDKRERLINWSSAPGARYCHPREEHLLPLHVCFGAACERGWKTENVYREDLMGFRNSGFHWSRA